MFGAQSTWAGNLGFQDNHVEFIQEPHPSSVTFEATTGVSGVQSGEIWNDNVFHADIAAGNDATANRIGNANDAVLRHQYRGIASGATTVNQATGTNGNGSEYIWID